MASLINDCIDLGISCFDPANLNGDYTPKKDFDQAFGETILSRESLKNQFGLYKNYMK